MNSKVQAERRRVLLEALDAEDAKLAEALERESNHPPVVPFNYDARSRLPRPPYPPPPKEP